VYAPSSAQPPLDRTPEQMGASESEVHTFFSSQSNIEKFITFLSLEDKKGRDKFNSKRFILFKVSLCLL
jgi:proteasome activator subunit 4